MSIQPMQRIPNLLLDLLIILSSHMKQPRRRAPHTRRTTPTQTPAHPSTPPEIAHVS